MNNHYNCVYMYVNKLNNKKYIGQTVNFNRRYKEHIRKSKNSNFLIHKAMKKDGIENFEIIILKENLNSKCLMNLYEYYYINKYKTLCKENGYNTSSGGHNGNPYAGKTEEEMNEVKRKMSENHADVNGENNPNYGIPCSEEKRIKISKNHADVNGINNPRCRKVIQRDLNGNPIKIWSYIKEVTDYYGWSYNAFRQHLNGTCSNKYKGFIWEFYEED